MREGMFNPIMLCSRYVTMLDEIDNDALERQIHNRALMKEPYYNSGYHTMDTAPGEEFSHDANGLPMSGESKKLVDLIHKVIDEEIVEGFRTYACWVHLVGDKEQTSLHSHSVYHEQHPHLSWVYYVKTPPDCGNLSFDTTIHTRHIWMEEESVAGKLVIFPWWMPHGTTKNNSGDMRISISGNCTGEFTDPKNLYNIIGLTD